jgi:hypothetical protein
VVKLWFPRERKDQERHLGKSSRVIADTMASQATRKKCFKLHGKPDGAVGKTETRDCHRCKLKGHIARGCPQKKSAESIFVGHLTSSNEEEEDNDDSGMAGCYGMTEEEKLQGMEDVIQDFIDVKVNGMSEPRRGWGFSGTMDELIASIASLGTPEEEEDPESSEKKDDDDDHPLYEESTTRTLKKS